MDLWTLSDLSTPWCVHVVATLRIADHIASGHTEIGQLAAASGADRDSSAADRGAVGRGVPGGGGGGSGDHRGAELFRPAAWRERPLCLEEGPRRLARWRGDGHSATLRGSGATVRPGGGLHRGGTRRGGIAGAADDGPGGWQGADVGRVSRDGSAGRFGAEGGGSAGFGARHRGVPAEVIRRAVGRGALVWRQKGRGGRGRGKGC